MSSSSSVGCGFPGARGINEKGEPFSQREKKANKQGMGEEQEPERQHKLAKIGEAALQTIKDSDPAAWLNASPELVKRTRAASEYLFALSSPYASSSCPLTSLLTDRFDAEQIWQQIDLQTRPLLSSLRRRIGKFERGRSDDSLFHDVDGEGKLRVSNTNYIVSNGAIRKCSSGTQKEASTETESEKLDSDEESSSDDEDSLGKPSIGNAEHASNAVDDSPTGTTLLEDRFLKLSDMEKFLDQAEAEDSRQVYTLEESFGSQEMGNVEESDDDGNTQMDSALHVLPSADKDGRNYSERIKYRDFFENDGKEKLGTSNSEYSDDRFDELKFVSDQATGSSQPWCNSKQQTESMSTHERKLQKIHKQVEQLEKANLEPKLWTLQGEVSAAKRPKNSALEVDLDFEHNARPAPVITEEVTASIEEMIRSRIAEERFDDIQRRPSVPTSSPKEQLGLDENKSRKGLGELYEEEYMQTTGLGPVPASASDGLKKEANILFKALCTRLDALSHFHFTPKPPIEDMAVQSDLPALAMEEVAPLAVSDANMLAPEEVFAGEGIMKTDREISHSERKRRRAKKKRMRKADKTKKDIEKKSFQNYAMTNGKGISQPLQKKQRTPPSQYWKPTKAFADLDKAKDAPKQDTVQKSDAPLPSFLRL